MYTGTIFNWHDNSGFNVGTEVVDTTNRPLFMVVNSFDKGPEKLMEVDATTFNALYGTMSYDRHGQGSIQAQKIIDAGGRLLIKRVCAADSDLANSVFVATINEGKLSWEIKSIGPTEDDPDAATPKTFAETKKAAMDFYKAGKTYPLFVITDIGRGKSIKAVRIIPDYDTSRGLEKMIYKFNIYEGTTLMESANISFDPTYQFNGEYYGLDKNRMTQVTAEVIPEIYEHYLEDITALVFPDVEPGTIEYEDAINTVSGFDLINACTYKVGKIYKNNEPTGKDSDVVLQMKMKEDGKTLDGDSLDVAYGNRFKYIGSYGSYGENPAKFGNEHKVTDFYDDGTFAEPYFIKAPKESTDPIFAKGGSEEGKYDEYMAYRLLTIDIADVYFGYDTDGKFIDEVWDVDTHKLFAVMDANYHKWVKDAMANFVEFRKDCIFFRDSGIGFYSVHDAQEIYTKYTLGAGADSYIKDFGSYINSGKYPIEILKDSIMAINNLRSRFIADYGTTFEVVDPATKKNIEVTMLYDMAAKLTELYINQGPFAPLAGTYNGFELDTAIDGTINFTPIITPTTNQKQAIDDIRLNYAIFEQEDQCVIQSNYTSQDMNSQLSFINNVLAIQEVARVVRTVCPRNRFRLITGSDMSEYANAVSRVLQGYSAYFETLEFQYTEDPLRSIQKIFYASINFSFNNWAQTEIFDLYALANTTTTSNNS